MKIRLFLILILTSTIYFYAQAKNDVHNYVTFVVEKSNGEIEVKMHYPEGTTYKIYLTKKDAETIKTESSAIYEGDLTLTVYPAYRKSKSEVFKYEGKRLRIYTTGRAASEAGFGDEFKDDQKVIQKEAIKSQAGSSNDISAVKVVMPSEKNVGKYNITLSFSNGVVFTYEDEKFNATQNGAYIDIKGKYLIQAETGVLKVSFDPADGELWWVFEKKKSH